MMEEDVDARERIFHNIVRDYILGLLLFILLYVISYAAICAFRRKPERDECCADDAGDALVYRISLWMCTFSLAVSVGAVLLLPISILANEALLMFPNSYYLQWINSSLIHGVWNSIFLCSNTSVFVLLPFAYFFTESEGLPGSKRGIRSRIIEASIVLSLLAVLVCGLVIVFSALIDDDDNSRILLFDLWTFYLPYLYSLMSLIGVVMLLICTPIGFVRLFTVMGQLITKPQFLHSIEEELQVIHLEEASLYRLLYPPLTSSPAAHDKVSSQCETKPCLSAVSSSLPSLRTARGSPTPEILPHQLLLSHSRGSNLSGSSSSLSRAVSSVPGLTLPSGELRASSSFSDLQAASKLENGTVLNGGAENCKPRVRSARERSTGDDQWSYSQAVYGVDSKRSDLQINSSADNSNNENLFSKLVEIQKSKHNLEKKQNISSLRRNLGYPLAVLLLLALMCVTVLLVVLNVVELLTGLKALPVGSKEVVLGITSLSALGTFGAVIEIAVILYLMLTSVVGFYSVPVLRRLLPVYHDTPMTSIIGNCMVIVILSSALPVLARTLGITNFDLLGNFGRLRWLGNLYIILSYNCAFAIATVICILTKFTATLRQALFNKFEEAYAQGRAGLRSNRLFSSFIAQRRNRQPSNKKHE